MPNLNHKLPHKTRSLITNFMVILVGAIILSGFSRPHPAATQAADTNLTALPSESNTLPHVYMPLMYKRNADQHVFGIETHSSIYPNNLITNYTVGLQANAVRLNGRISWRELQPEEGAPIDWGLLADFETELRTLRAADITPIIIADDYPHWATIYPTSCGPLLPEHYADFAAFMGQLVSRYSTPEFNVHIWEMGNEPDVDPRLLPADSFYGCWGNWDDPFYNGRAYGNMLKVVTPAIRAADPQAQVWTGGLLLASPNTQDGNIGQPEDFFRGILEAGAAPYFDVVTYHAYAAYYTQKIDGDLYYTDALGVRIWDAWGGIIRGKGRFLRSIMDEYSVDKPLFVTETSLLCGWCSPSQLPNFYDMQANLAPRSFTRAIADGIGGFIWYTLEGPGWNNCGLLDEYMNPKPAYYTYQTLATMISSASFIDVASYGEGIEAYSFDIVRGRLDIIYSTENVTYSIRVPKSHFIAAYDRFGNLITPTPENTDYLLTIQFEPIYLLRSP